MDDQLKSVAVVLGAVLSLAARLIATTSVTTAAAFISAAGFVMGGLALRIAWRSAQKLDEFLDAQTNDIKQKLLADGDSDGE